MRRGRREEGMGWEGKGGKRRGKGEREGRKGTEEGPTKNSCRGAQNVKLRHWDRPYQFSIDYVKQFLNWL